MATLDDQSRVCNITGTAKKKSGITLKMDTGDYTRMTIPLIKGRGLFKLWAVRYREIQIYDGTITTLPERHLFSRRALQQAAMAQNMHNIEIARGKESPRLYWIERI